MTLLKHEYIDFIDRTRSALHTTITPGQLSHQLADTQIQHLARLRSMVISYIGQTSIADGNAPLLQSVVCNEYSPALQSDVLCLPDKLVEPVLDIGCGNGTLVTSLVADGIDAYGIDRCAPTTHRLTQADWFDTTFSPESWGTIIAHQSISTHFIFHHNHGTSEATEYAALIMRLLTALKIGGTLYYAPGLPFFEPLIETLDSFEVTKTSISCNAPSSVNDIAYGTAIKRLKC